MIRVYRWGAIEVGSRRWRLVLVREGAASVIGGRYVLSWWAPRAWRPLRMRQTTPVRWYASFRLRRNGRELPDG